MVFAFDLTASMGGELRNVKQNAAQIVTEINSVISDVQFGVLSHQDYPGTFRSSASAGDGCNYFQRYGERTDRPYRLHQTITDVTMDVVSSISGLRLGSGSDGPESYSRLLYESYAELAGETSRKGPIGWRTDAKKIVVAFGDNVPHDCNYNAILGGVADSGINPGRDEIVGTADDLRILDVLDGMADNGVTLINLFSGDSKHVALWDAYADRTGGTNFVIDSDGSFPGGLTPAERIADLIESEVSHYDEVTLRVCAGDAAFAPWIVDVSPPSYTDVDVPDVFDFDLTVGPPDGTLDGNYFFGLCLFGDDIELARQSVSMLVQTGGGAPVLVVDPTTLSFTAPEGSDPPTQPVTVTNAGPIGSTLNWTATVNETWLSVLPDNGSLTGGASENFTVTVTSSGLAPGTYTDDITVTAPGAIGSPKVIPVTLTVIDPDVPVAAIGLNKSSLKFTKSGSPPPDMYFTVENVGDAGSTLHWMADIAPAAPWLTVSPMSGSLRPVDGPTQLTVSVDCTGLALGDYSTTITIMDPAASNTPQDVHVDLTIRDGSNCLDILDELEQLIADYEDDGIIPGTAESQMLAWIAEARHQMLVGGSEGPNPHAAAEQIFQLIRFIEAAVIDGRISEEDAMPLLDLAHEFLECIGIPFPPPQPPEKICGPILDDLDGLIGEAADEGIIPPWVEADMLALVAAARAHMVGGDKFAATGPILDLIALMEGGVEAGHVSAEDAEPILTAAADFLDCIGPPPPCWECEEEDS